MTTEITLAPSVASKAPVKSKPAPRDPYWEQRKNSIYLFAAQRICRKFSPSPLSVLDVGSNATPTLEWHRKTAKRMVSVDLVRPYEAPGVESIATDFFLYSPPARFDLVTCMQVLEHIPDPTPFARKLLECGDVCVASVPYNWEKGKCKHHLHDPVDRIKMLEWFGRKPDFEYIATELHGVTRMIQVYQTSK